MAQIPAAYLPFPSTMNQQQFYPQQQASFPQIPQQQLSPPPPQWSYGQLPGPYPVPMNQPQMVYIPAMNQFLPSVASSPLNLHLNLNLPNPMHPHPHTNLVNPPMAITPTVSSSSSLTPRLSTPSTSPSPYSMSPGPQNGAPSMSPPAKRRQDSREQRFIVIFDWDDTLFPTSTVIHDEESKKSVTAEELHRFGKEVYEMLAEYISVFGHQNLFIVTNGARKWVLKSLKDLSVLFQAKAAQAAEDAKRGERESASKCPTEDYFAAIYNSFLSLKLEVISAQHLHSEQYPQQTTLWKTMVFKKIVKEHFNLQSAREGIIHSIVSIGDSETEFVASYEAKCMVDTRNQLNCTNNISRLHRIKLRARPSMEEMVEQMQFLKNHAAVFYEETGSSTIRYE